MPKDEQKPARRNHNLTHDRYINLIPVTLFHKTGILAELLSRAFCNNLIRKLNKFVRELRATPRYEIEMFSETEIVIRDLVLTIIGREHSSNAWSKKPQNIINCKKELPRLLSDHLSASRKRSML
ncbi:hypothetical protein CEXT_13561 [Caerostris extrusa]|uniref:Uncharacterized protein n=1 Tax=Caerostris extrusa TaxID=172846 RepID=A0AAV4YD37_CAEEX|nr:hypothetical protein CEXT_13561 [Caerostris extrusa]